MAINVSNQKIPLHFNLDLTVHSVKFTTALRKKVLSYYYIPQFSMIILCIHTKFTLAVAVLSIKRIGCLTIPNVLIYITLYI